MQIIFKSEIEFTPDSFCELNPKQLEAYERKVGKPDGPIYNVVQMEPTVVERHETGVVLELNIVVESQRQLMLDAVAFVYRASAEMPDQNPTFAQRLQYLRPRLPPVVIGFTDGPESNTNQE